MTLQTKPTPPSNGLWDGDSLIWRFGWASHQQGALISCSQFIKACNATLDLKHFTIFISDNNNTNFRYTLYNKYKATRSKTARPHHEEYLRKALMESFDATIIAGAEVDDALGISQMASMDQGSTDTIIFSNDKDLNMIPGWHFDIDYRRAVKHKDTMLIRKAYLKNQLYFIEDPGFISLRQSLKKKVLVGGGHLFLCVQLLSGDSSDNIPGLYKLSTRKKRMGPAFIFNALKNCHTFEEGIKVCYTLYKKYILEPEENVKKLFLRNCKLLWIKRKDGRETIFPEEWLS
jgi:5'-3' exonuclease